MSEGRVPYPEVKSNTAGQDDKQENNASEKEERGGWDRLRDELSGGSQQRDRVAENNGAGSDQLDWRKELTTAYSNLRELRNLDGKTDAESQQKRAELVAQVDAGFQKAFPYVQENATAADLDMTAKGIQYQEIQQEKADLAKKMNLPQGTALTMEQAENGVLNAKDDSQRNMYTQYAALLRLEDRTAERGGQDMQLRHLPVRVAMEYANFLSEHKNGVSTDIRTGQPFTSLDVVRNNMSPELMASGGRQQIERSGEQQAENARKVVADKDNPLLALQTALQQSTPQDAIPHAKRAAELAAQLTPEHCKQKIEEIKKELAKPETQKDAVKSHELSTDIASWESLSKAGGLSNVILGRLLLQQNPPDFGAARDALLKASKNPEGANMLLDERGQPLLNQLLMLALTDGKQEGILDTIQKTGSLMSAAGEKANQAANEKDEGRRNQALTEAIRSAEQALQQAKLLRETFGGADGKAIKAQLDELGKKPENERTPDEKKMYEYLKSIQELSAYEANIKATIASWDLGKGDGRAADALLQDIAHNHPEYLEGKDDAFKHEFEKMKKGAADLKHDQEIDESSGWNPLNWPAKFGKWCGENWKWITFGAAVAIGVVATLATAGAAGPLAAVLIGTSAALVGGTALGTGMQMAGGKTGFGEAVMNAAPVALAGGVAGSLGAYYFAPAAFAGSGLGVATGGSMWATSAAGAKIGFASGAIWNAEKVRQGYLDRKYDNGWQALGDWGLSTAGWTVSGALGGPFVASGATGLAAIQGGGLTKGAFALNGLKVALGGQQIFTQPTSGEMFGKILTGPAAMAGYKPRYLVQEVNGITERQYNEWQKALQEQDARQKAEQEMDARQRAAQEAAQQSRPQEPLERPRATEKPAATEPKVPAERTGSKSGELNLEDFYDK